MTSPSAASAGGGRAIVIRPWRPGPLGRLRELWRYRAVIPYLGGLYMLRRVRRTYLGWMWIPLRPLMDIGARTLFFGGLLGASSGDRPYFIFIAFGTAGWTLFDRILHWGTRAVRLNRGISGRTHVPRLPALVAAVIQIGRAHV